MDIFSNFAVNNERLGDFFKMTPVTLNQNDPKSGSADAPKTYSPQELAEVYMTSRADFFGINLGEVTLNWNQNYLFSFLKSIGQLPIIDLLTEYLICQWEEENLSLASYTDTLSLSESQSVFVATLKDIRAKVAEDLERKAKMERLKQEMLNGYSPAITTGQTTVNEPTVTKGPEFQSAPAPESEASNPTHRILLTDLPEDIRNQIAVSQRVFDVYVEQLNEDLWLTVKKDKSQLCGCLFFLSNFHYVTSRNTTHKQFDTLLHYVIEELKGQPSVSLESSIRRRNEVLKKNIERSYKCYACADASKSMEKEIFMLRNDCEKLADGFQPVLDAIAAERRVANVPGDQAQMASSAA